MSHRFKVEIVHRPLDNGHNLFYYQVKTPRGEVALDHLSGPEIAEQYCAIFNRALADYIPIVKAARDIMGWVDIDDVQNPVFRGFFVALKKALEVLENDHL